MVTVKRINNMEWWQDALQIPVGIVASEVFTWIGWSLVGGKPEEGGVDLRDMIFKAAVGLVVGSGGSLVAAEVLPSNLETGSKTLAAMGLINGILSAVALSGWQLLPEETIADAAESASEWFMESAQTTRSSIANASLIEEQLRLKRVY